VVVVVDVSITMYLFACIPVVCAPACAYAVWPCKVALRCGPVCGVCGVDLLALCAMWACTGCGPVCMCVTICACGPCVKDLCTTTISTPNHIIPQRLRLHARRPTCPYPRLRPCRHVQLAVVTARVTRHVNANRLHRSRQARHGGGSEAG